MSTAAYFLTAFALGIATWAAFIAAAFVVFNHHQRTRDMRRGRYLSRINKHVLRRG